MILNIQPLYIFYFFYQLSLLYCVLGDISNLELDGSPTKENLFGQSALLMNPMYIAFAWGEL